MKKSPVICTVGSFVLAPFVVAFFGLLAGIVVAAILFAIDMLFGLPALPHWVRYATLVCDVLAGVYWWLYFFFKLYSRCMGLQPSEATEQV